MTHKLVTLLALASSQRAQTLEFIDVNSIMFGEDLVTIPIYKLLKTSTVKNNKFSLKLKSYDKFPNICVVRALKVYISRTKSLRGSETKLFISFVKPHYAVSRSTISRWIKSVLEEAGIDIDVFKAHSTRSASCAMAKRDGVCMDQILKTAGWSNNRTFKKF